MWCCSTVLLFRILYVSYNFFFFSFSSLSKKHASRWTCCDKLLKLVLNGLLTHSLMFSLPYLLTHSLPYFFTYSFTLLLVFTHLPTYLPTVLSLHESLWWSGVSGRFYSCLTQSIPGIASIFTAI